MARKKSRQPRHHSTTPTLTKPPPAASQHDSENGTAAAAPPENGTPAAIANGIQESARPLTPATTDAIKDTNGLAPVRPSAITASLPLPEKAILTAKVQKEPEAGWAILWRHVSKTFGSLQ